MTGVAPRTPATAREIEDARALMHRFAVRTGLGSDRPSRRYLWTDAFAVCNYLGLWRATGDARELAHARTLVDAVHAVLGRHRDDDVRRGPLGGLSDAEAALHPTRGGLRIGKKLPERPPDAPFDERLEWDRDGQYFHYLTKWMHALDQVARWAGDVRCNTWARELADVAHRAFTRTLPGGRGVVWKMSIDLSRPLVASMGQHDPVDGLVTCLELRATAASLSAPDEPTLDDATADFARLVDVRGLATADPLGIGSLLVDAARVAQLMEARAIADPTLLEALLDAALAGLAHFERRNDLSAPAEHRLAFRELGLAIGLRALGGFGRGERVRTRLEGLARYAPLGARITEFWRGEAPRATSTWADHEDIDDVMLATSLVPDGVLLLRPADTASRSR